MKLRTHCLACSEHTGSIDSKKNNYEKLSN